MLFGCWSPCFCGMFWPRLEVYNPLCESETLKPQQEQEESPFLWELLSLTRFLWSLIEIELSVWTSGCISKPPWRSPIPVPKLCSERSPFQWIKDALTWNKLSQMRLNQISQMQIPLKEGMLELCGQAPWLVPPAAAGKGGGDALGYSCPLTCLLGYNRSLMLPAVTHTPVTL